MQNNLKMIFLQGYTLQKLHADVHIACTSCINYITFVQSRAAVMTKNALPCSELFFIILKNYKSVLKDFHKNAMIRLRLLAVQITF